MKPVIFEELIRANAGYDEAELIVALWDLYEATREEHNIRHFEPECPQCVAVKKIERLCSEPCVT